MAKGERFKSEAKEYKGERALRPTLQLTDNGADNHHIYLNVPTFTSDGASLVYLSSRGGSYNACRMDLATFESIQLTDCEDASKGAWYLEATREFYFWDKNVVTAVNIDTLDERAISEGTDERRSISVTCDGRHVVFPAMCEKVDGFGEEFAGRHCLMVADGRGGDARPILTAPFHIGHIEASPSDAGKIVYCWENVWWEQVPQRIWETDPQGRLGGPLGRQRADETRGHEFFSPSGGLIGYHGVRHTLKREGGYSLENDYHFVGLMNSDGTNDRQWRLPDHVAHCQINHAEDQLVCDQRTGFTSSGREAVALIHTEGDKGVFEPLFYHGSSFEGQGAHPHPQFRPGDGEVVFATDFTGSSNIYLTSLV